MARKPAQGPVFDASVRVCVLHGPEAFLKTEFTDRLKEAAEAASGEVQTVRFDGQSASVGDIIEECRSFGLMASHKFVVVDEADQLVKGDAARRAMERYAENPSDEATLVLRAEKWTSGNLDKLIAAKGFIYKCEAILPHQAVNWAVKRCEKRHRATITRQAAAMLVELLGVDLVRLDTELAKLAIGVGEGGEIGEEHVGALVVQSRSDDFWSVRDALTTGDPRQALDAIREVIEVGGENPVTVCVAMTDAARRVEAFALGIACGVPPASVAGQAKIWPRDSIEPTARLAQRLGPARARALVIDAMRTDAALKSGRGDPRRNIERLALRFCGFARS